MADHIVYRGGYKYQTVAAYHYQTGIETHLGSQGIGNDYVTLYPTGILEIAKGYAWDGPSGPTIDTPNFMRGSLIHDALYQLMREGFLAQAMRPTADAILRKICLEDGMNSIRAAIVYAAVRKCGASCANPSAEKKPMVAP